MALIKVTPDKEKARSVLRMGDTTLERIKETKIDKFPSHITRDYYDVIRELASIILLLDGYTTTGEGAHKRIIEYLEKNYKHFSYHEISFIDKLRVIRNKVAYDGFFVKRNFIGRKLEDIWNIITKLKQVIGDKLDFPK